MKKQHSGICRLCGTEGKLSFEHVPPASAFNDQPILRSTFEQMLASEHPDEFEGSQQQRGAGGYTLCGKCNSDTGLWYVPAFTSWAQQAMCFVLAARGKPSLEYPFNLFPLRVLKQVICMFFSVNGTYFHKANPDLVRFILNKNSRDLPERARVYAFYTLSNRFRASGVQALAKGSNIYAFSEITFPPFGFVLTLNSDPPQTGFCEISSFSQFEYRDWRCGITMRLPLMPIYTGLPGDYRTREQTLADAARNAAAPTARLDLAGQEVGRSGT
jgi:hypothetical protein